MIEIKIYEADKLPRSSWRCKPTRFITVQFNQGNVLATIQNRSTKDIGVKAWQMGKAGKVEIT